MLKIGKVSLSAKSDKTYYIVSHSDDLGNSRNDLLEYVEYYHELDSSRALASVIVTGGVQYSMGEVNIMNKASRIINQSVFLTVPERKSAKVVDGKFILEVSKESDDESIMYLAKYESGRLVSEFYKTADGIVEYYQFDKSSYDSKQKPLNWDEYEMEGKVVKESAYKTVKTLQAEFLPYEELLRKFPQVTHVLEHDYVIALSYEEAEKRLKQWIEAPEQLKSVDIESYSTDWGPYSENRITGVFLGFGEEWSTYFPFRQQNFPYNLPIEYLRKIFDAVNSQPAYPQTIILAHNAKFEIQGFYQEFREYLRVDIDTYVLAVLINPLIKKNSHTLKTLTSQVDNKFYLELKHIFIGPIRFNVLPPEIVLLYGCPDATSPAKVYKSLIKKLPKDELFVMHLDMGIIIVKAINEFYGINMNQERLKKLIDEEEYKVNLLSNMFRKIHKTSRNINSPDVLADIIYNKLRCKVEVYTDKGKPATSKFAIDRIIDLGAQKITEDTVIPADILGLDGKPIIEGVSLAKNKYPSLVIYQTYKKCCKELGALKRLVNRSVGGYFKFYINQVGAGSNRQTSDAHQFSDTMKSCAIADSPYHGLVSCDYKQVELRILAGMAGEEPLIEKERNPDIDIHRAILSIIKKKPIWQISEEERKSGKGVNFGVVYMMSEYGLARREYGPGYTAAQLNEQRQKITDFFNGLPRIKKLLKDNEEFLKEHGYIKTAFNYYRYFPELLDPTTEPKLVKSLIRSGNNTPVQGTGAQLLKMAETKVWAYIRKKGWDKLKDYGGIMLPMVRMILPIHDEILLSYDKEIPKEEIIAMFKECMELDIEGMPPFFAAPAFIDNWYEGKDPVYEVDIPFRDEVVERWKNGEKTFVDGEYVSILKKYRNNEIRTYMTDLISKYHTPEEVAKHIDHPSITHTLIEVMIDKADRKKLTHEERILEAAKRYIANMDKEEVKDMQIVNTEDDLKDELMAFDEWATQYVHTDETGALIVESLGEEAEYADDTYYEDESMLYDVDSAEAPNFMYLASECIVDLTNYTLEQAKVIDEKIKELSTDDSYYSVCYVNKFKVMDAGFKINAVDKELAEIFNSMEVRT